MIRPLTDNQKNVLDFIKKHIKKKKKAPTHKEIADGLKLSGASSAQAILHGLWVKGKIEIYSHIPRGIKVL